MGATVGGDPTMRLGRRAGKDLIEYWSRVCVTDQISSTICPLLRDYAQPLLDQGQPNLPPSPSQQLISPGLDTLQLLVPQSTLIHEPPEQTIRVFASEQHDGWSLQSNPEIAEQKGSCPNDRGTMTE
jgi:hypothetical protein